MRAHVSLSAVLVSSLGLFACGNGGTATGDAGADVARCQSTAAAVTCGDTGRQCAARALSTACTTERADLLADALACIRDNSDASGCRSFADPSGADTCIHAALQSGAARVIDVAMQLSLICGPSFPATVDEAMYGMTPPLPTLSDASLAAITTCVMAAADCTAATACFSSRYPQPYACFP